MNKIHFRPHNRSIHIRIKSDWYEHSKKSRKFFLNSEKQRESQNTIKKLIAINKEITQIRHRMYKGILQNSF